MGYSGYYRFFFSIYFVLNFCILFCNLFGLHFTVCMTNSLFFFVLSSYSYLSSSSPLLW